MKKLQNQIELVQTSLKEKLDDAGDAQTLESIRVEFLGRSGKVAGLMAALKSLPVEEKRNAGPLLNEFKKETERMILTAHENLVQKQRENAVLKMKNFDVTAYKTGQLDGSINIYTHVAQQLEDVFISMGYQIVEGPEVESEYYNFDALNIPGDHPARDMHDTFWLSNPGMLLRTHTSTVQIREMEAKGVPIAVCSTGRCYRNEAVDAKHNFMFRQYEGLLIDKNISVANLLATAQQFLQAFFEKEDLKIRVRPGYFPFVEPGLEIDGSCPLCSDGCSVCKGTGWMELLGAGLVHPNVLRSCGVDPNEYSGFAFGGGIERIAMIKYGITDIRLFNSSKIDVLKQF